MKALIYTLTLKEPLLATQPFSGEANSATSYNFIPGSMLRGALIGAYLNDQFATAGDVDENNLLADDLAQRCFFSGDIKFLNAYPQDPGTQARMLPTPHAWFVAKEDVEDEHSTVHNFAAQLELSLAKPSAPQGVFCHVIADAVTLLDPIRQVTVHNASQNRNRKAAGISQLYRYDALAAGQSFTGVILGNSNADLEHLQKLLEERLVTVGGSQTAGYGLVKVAQADLDPTWAGEYETQPATGNIVTLTLLSDAILRPKGQSVMAALAAALGVSEKDLTAYQKTRVIGGFNRKWGLPLPEAQALQAGSVFCLPAAAVDMETLSNLETSGLGERRIDGFGRLAINWHSRPTYQRQPVAEAYPESPPDLTPTSQKIATRMANQLLRRQLEQALVNNIVRYRGQFKGLPSMTQLSRVRVVARHAILSNDLSLIKTHLESLKLAARQWENARLGQSSLAAWINQQCELSVANFKQTFGVAGSNLPTVADQTSNLPDKIQIEYQARLIDGVLKLAIEEARADAAPQQTGGQQ